uniref:Uncharacterized protein n=1 Tax=Escherichia coli TaxID=562 RepID=A0A2R4ADX7_ECOLX|nr:hypothetical protein p300-5_00131 [Escherichia coli]
MLVQHMAAAAQHPAGFGQWCEQIYPYITDAAETGGPVFFVDAVVVFHLTLPWLMACDSSPRRCP